VPLQDQSLDFWSPAANQWQIACGAYPVYAGTNVDAVSQTGSLQVC